MDGKNRFFTPGTYTLTRLEYFFVLLALIVLAIIQRSEINWWIFAAMIAVTDGVGYVAGAIAYRRKKEGQEINSIYYVLYNILHSLFFVALVVGLWWLAFGPDWTLLAMPIHLCTDRSVFGNFFKPIGGVEFEPVVHPAFAEFEKKFEQSRQSKQSPGSMASKNSPPNPASEQGRSPSE